MLRTWQLTSDRRRAGLLPIGCVGGLLLFAAAAAIAQETPAPTQPPATAAGAKSSTAGKVRLVEDPDPDRLFEVTARLTVRGRVLAPIGGTRVIPLPLQGTATLKWQERRLPAAGEFQQSLRAVRRFVTAESDFRVDRKRTRIVLRPSVRTIVSEGTATGLRHFGLDGPLTAAEGELLEFAGDPLGLAAVLPVGEVPTDHAWQAGTWTLPLLTGLDAVNKGRLNGRIVKVTAAGTTVKIEGTVEGAVAGTASEITLTGTLLFDHRGGLLRRAEIVQEEHRQAGPVSPGLEVVARLVIERHVVKVQGKVRDPLPRSLVTAASRKPTAAQLRLLLVGVGGVRLFHDRRWHLFHQTDEVAILRRLEKGRLVAQCNISNANPVARGRATPASEFVAGVRQALGRRLTAIDSIEAVMWKAGHRGTRVIASGIDHGLPMRWIYYLCTSATGQQTSLVFAVEERRLKTWANRDQRILEGLSFPSPPKTTARK